MIYIFKYCLGDFFLINLYDDETNETFKIYSIVHLKRHFKNQYFVNIFEKYFNDNEPLLISGI
ncbi:hypothetical protein BpHYR1_013403 [Brachionus plicatilis]|uniref:Uncharacterized protein n=1 Tax=Brachionus plicatilis TaxID=10195 RepID=A0A3M7RGX2_BRAPC|nr:hypothetical protein BpHYR1_013403 [Brachionus plicatilis]